MNLQTARPLVDQAADQWRLLEGKLAPGEAVLLSVHSGSMLPLIPAGAQIAVVATTGAGRRVGDIVVFRRGDRLIAHRLLFGWGHEPGGWFLERGDGVSAAGFIRARQILGLVVEVQDPAVGQLRLDTPQAAAAGLRLARRSLARFVLTMLESPVRKACSWFRSDSTGSA